MKRTINIRSKGEITEYLQELVQEGQIRPCVNLHLEKWPSGDYGVKCAKDWASQISATNVDVDITGYTAPSAYSWPKCPVGCRHFIKSEDFEDTVSRDQYDDQNREWEEASKPETAQSNPASAMPGATVVNEDMEIEHIGPAVQYPERVTLRWLIDHVPMKFWLWLLGIVVAVAIACFGWGYHAANLPIVQQWQGTDQKVAPAATAMPATTTKNAALPATTKIPTKK